MRDGVVAQTLQYRVYPKAAERRLSALSRPVNPLEAGSTA
jgi:hypothetical protein